MLLYSWDLISGILLHFIITDLAQIDEALVLFLTYKSEFVTIESLKHVLV